MTEKTSTPSPAPVPTTNQVPAEPAAPPPSPMPTVRPFPENTMTFDHKIQEPDPKTIIKEG
jgi:hypothetical protein